MKVYYNSKLAKRLLFGNFKTCMFFGTVITKLAQLSARTKRHEGIHIRQFWECCVLGAVLWCLGHGAAHLFCGHLSAGWLLLVPFTYYLLYGGCPRPMERRSLPRFGIRNGSLRPRERARIPT